MNQTSDSYLQTYIDEQGLAEKMIPAVGTLYREHGVIITVFGRKLMGASVIEIVKAHRLSQQMENCEIQLTDTAAYLDAIAAKPPGTCRIDIGRLAVKGIRDKQTAESIINKALQPVANNPSSSMSEPVDVVLYGFGRIGRIMARLLIERTTSANPMRLRAIVVRGGKDGDLAKRASLLRRDSIHGPFNGHITVDEEQSAIIANGNFIKVIYANQPEDIDYTEYGINNALIVDNTGVFKDREALSRHVVPNGASKVLLTAPAKGDVKNIVYGVNHDTIADDDNVICAAVSYTHLTLPTTPYV